MDARGLRCTLAASALVLAAALAAGCGSAAPAPATGGQYAKLYQANGSAAVTAGQAVTVELGDMYFKPNALTAAKGAPVRLDLHNAGAIPHNFSLDAFGVNQNVDPGKTQTVTFTPSAAATYYFYCNVPGHAASGMVGELVVQ